MTESNSMSEYDWITLQDELSGIKQETTKERLKRKLKENPLVPIGCLATTIALTYGLWSFRTGQQKMAQYMMRTRVAAQGFTVVALIVGIGFTATQVK